MFSMLVFVLNFEMRLSKDGGVRDQGLESTRWLLSFDCQRLVQALL